MVETEDINTYRVMQRPVRWRLRPEERRVVLLLGDLIVNYFALFLALYFWASSDHWLNFSLQFVQQRTDYWFYLLPLFWVLLIIELYDERAASRRVEVIRGVAIAAAISLGLYFMLYFSSSPGSLPRRGVAGFIIAASILTIFWRLIYIRIFTAPMFMRRVLIIGAGRGGTTLVHVVKEIWPPPFFLVGLIDDSAEKIGAQIDGFTVLGDSQKVLSIIEKEHVTDLVCAISGEMSPDMFQVLLSAEERGIEVTTMPVIYEELLRRVPIFLLQSDWILRSFLDQAHTGGFYEMAKRLVDIGGGLTGVVCTIILFPFIALATLIDTGSPIFYLQNRLTRNGKIYRIIKFRTMCKDAEKDGKARPASENDTRVTRVGRILRKSHLDELPQFINVMVGDMSLVGPRAERPEIIEELQNKVPFYRARLLVKPGLTGWAQINFGYASGAEANAVKLEYDLYYIKHRNILLDFTIILRTLGTVVGLRGQ
ncbi:MAG: sugar transferase [Anaerolineaceae bacterium]|nr:sugar transferase [Anaerolineaceae bacterium]